MQVAFSVAEGSRVTISRLEVKGNEHFTADQLSKVIDSQPEGFLWFRPASTTTASVDRDVRDHLPAWYGQHGMIDMQVTRDTLLPDPATGKAILRMIVEEGKVYQVGTVSILGNRRFSAEELGGLHPVRRRRTGVGSGKMIGGVFDRTAWESRHRESARAVPEQRVHRRAGERRAVARVRWRMERR